ncbi:sugar phosphate isomerase/epimerase family protein [Terriglobus saanensis]|uniref:Xylose isomerase domain-containing protein TIM barrel n=1 Tax=Terriglobus saanensis (strain ATCC BAA-1853 / DSM 23119 / SP1PR4) TaxID=401053 RepID=E8V2P4_TERSS|nr:sugar phosphate isomerase/epimerase family protein [Terriglobus saanensis]ADV83519.1 Xylose isomerase domain-containing protein TIM barrel [Terriglobus saanensis SP1PR4]
MGLSNRRSFLQSASALLASTAFPLHSQARETRSSSVPRLGIVVQVKRGGSSEEVIKHVHDLGFPTCQIFFDELNMREAQPLLLALKKYGVEVSALSEHNPGPRIFDFYRGPLTIGILPQEHRRARIDALKLAADFARTCDIPSIHTHLGFIPEDPNDPTYPVAVEAIKEVAQHCKDQGRMLLCETGEETPITMLRMIQDVGTGNVFVNLDTANLILYGKGNPVDAMDVFGHLVRGMHAKDGLFPTNPRTLGEEVAIGTGRVDFPALFKKLKEVNYDRTVTIEREISGPKQTADILQSKVYLQHLIDVNFG